MLRKFKIKLDGTEYLVEMEEIGGVAQPTVVSQPTKEVPQPTEDPKLEAAIEARPAEVTAEGEVLTAPMPGTILRILVEVGETVQENQPLLILEAMKMENEIVAKSAGVIAGINVNQGAVVNPGDPLVVID